MKTSSKIVDVSTKSLNPGLNPEPSPKLALTLTLIPNSNPNP